MKDILPLVAIAMLMPACIKNDQKNCREVEVQVHEEQHEIQQSHEKKPQQPLKKQKV